MLSVDEVRALAGLLHRHQTDKAGQPYADHVRRVGDALREQGAPDHVVMAGYLHDTVEDGVATLDELGVEWCVRRDVVDLVRVLTRYQASYPVYLAQVAAVPDAVLVKRADIADNTRPDRLACLDVATRARLERKYADALAVL